ncbi:MAG TPA: efflux RND transporter periplasmic adaptor subunit [Bacteroidota bacterium]|nr:efflux RND transporter periplasmic adaptor subunit [Bacteroidota bacterium]
MNYPCISNRNFLKVFFIAMLAIILIAGCESGRKQAEQATPGSSAPTEYYTCVMHPSIHSDKPGACPICGMALVRRTTEIEVAANDTMDLRPVSISPRERILANVRSDSVRRETLNREIDAVGIIDFAEPNLRHITMRFSGRLDRLFLQYTGQQVKRGDPVALVYSPEAISAQEEFILALKSVDVTGGEDSVIGHTPMLLTSQSQEKLLELGFSSSQIETLRKTRKVESHVTIVSPISGTVIKKYVDPQHYAAEGEVIYDVADLSTVWMYADVYEQDLRFVKVGQFVDISTDAYPGEYFSGRVTFIEPVMNSETRTARIRTEFINHEGKLKPQMFVSVQFYHVTPEALVIPASSVLRTGKRDLVWVEDHPNLFVPRIVSLGSDAGDLVEVLSGLREGEMVASSGGFLIDSESELDIPEHQSPVPHGNGKEVHQ